MHYRLNNNIAVILYSRLFLHYIFLSFFVQQTGIMEMRAAMQEKEDAKTLKSKQRGKVSF